MGKEAMQMLTTFQDWNVAVWRARFLRDTRIAKALKTSRGLVALVGHVEEAAKAGASCCQASKPFVCGGGGGFHRQSSLMTGVISVLWVTVVLAFGARNESSHY